MWKTENRIKRRKVQKLIVKNPFIQNKKILRKFKKTVIFFVQKNVRSENLTKRDNIQKLTVEKLFDPTE